MSRSIYFSICLLIFVHRSDLVGIAKLDKNIRRFPKDFVFGVATAAYQIEGGWNASGKGENIWDHLTHTRPDMIADRSNGDIACDSYNQINRDIEMLEEIGVDYYRFSISWSRILPTGYVAEINQDGIDYYNKLINSLINKNIIPFVTIYHWDLPENLQKIGGWTNPLMEVFFEDYANLVFKLFGDRVKHWVTFNEPKQICLYGYGEVEAAPALNFSGIGEYMCGHTLLNSHARAYRLYDQKYRILQEGSIGITIEATWGEAFSDSYEDKKAADDFMAFDHGWFMNPIFSRHGDYPRVMKTKIAIQSERQGFSKSRLPEFTRAEKIMLKGSADFLGLNFYTSRMVKHLPTIAGLQPSFYTDLNVDSYVNKSWPTSASSWLKVTPWAFEKMLDKIRIDYDNPDVLVTENGYSSRGGLADNDRVRFINYHLNTMMNAMEKGSNVKAYTIWTLMDNFEWTSGYTERFGLFEVDFNSPLRKRVARDSAKYFKKVIATRSVDHHEPNYYCLVNDDTHVYF